MVARGGPWLRVQMASKRVTRLTKTTSRTLCTRCWVSDEVPSELDCMLDGVVDTVEVKVNKGS